jgi:hypothetical protein
LVAHQIGQLQVVEQEVQELLAGELEDEVVLALAALAGRPCPPPLPSATLGPADAVPGMKSLLPGWTMSRVPPGPWWKTGSEMSFDGMPTFSPLSTSVMLRWLTASATARLSWVL